MAETTRRRDVSLVWQVLKIVVALYVLFRIGMALGA